CVTSTTNVGRPNYSHRRRFLKRRYGLHLPLRRLRRRPHDQRPHRGRRFLLCRRHRVSLPPSLLLPPTTASRSPSIRNGAVGHQHANPSANNRTPALYLVALVTAKRPLGSQPSGLCWSDPVPFVVRLTSAPAGSMNYNASANVRPRNVRIGPVARITVPVGIGWVAIAIGRIAVP